MEKKLDKNQENRVEEVTKNKYIMITHDKNIEIENIITIDNIESMNMKKLKSKVYELKRFFRKKSNSKGIIFENKEIILLLYAKDLNNENVNSLIISLKAMFIKNKLERYNYLYDKACEFLDEEFEKKNYCNFENDVCVAKRECSTTRRKKMGCCYHFDKRKVFGKLVLCEHLVDKRCQAQCISCKLVTCNYIDVKFEINNIVYLDVFFNKIQKLIIKMSCFKTKKIILKRLLFWSL